MPRTVSQAFQEFMQRYEPTPWQKDTISLHHNYIRSVLNNKISVIEDFLTGSYIKQTQIKPVTDIDLFIVVDSIHKKNYYPNRAIKFVYDFKKLVRETYPNSSLKADGQAIVITFSDGLKMDLVPAFLRENVGYLIPCAKNNSWIPTNPKKYNELMSKANQALEGKLKHIIKMMKCWNVTHRNLLKSLHIEVLLLNCFYDFSLGKCYFFESYQEGLEMFFMEAKNSIYDPSYEPISGDQIYKYLDKKIWKRKFLALLLRNHYSQIMKAIEYEYHGCHKKAIMIWKMLFREYFPSYH